MYGSDKKYIGHFNTTGRARKIISLPYHLGKPIKLYNNKRNSQAHGNQKPLGTLFKIIPGNGLFGPSIGEATNDDDNSTEQERGRQIYIVHPVLPRTTDDISTCPAHKPHQQTNNSEPEHHFPRPIVLFLFGSLSQVHINIK